MSNQVLDNSNISVHLGKVSQYKSTYDKGLLVREPRQSNRTYLGIYDDNLPFVGFDTWNAYECSFLLDNGCPVTGVAKVVYPANSKYIVESKSLKLYFNSFNMERMGKSVKEAAEKFTKTANADLSELLCAGVTVGFILPDTCDRVKKSAKEVYSRFQNIEMHIDPKDLAAATFDTYNETPSLLKADFSYNMLVEQNMHSALLKSNCRVTSQPDWGDVYIHIITKYDVNRLDMLKYIVSFRNECHFHEEICECIYKRLYDTYEPTQLFVMCLYARRGGIDINPARASNIDLLYNLSANLSNIDSPHVKTSKQ